MRSSESTGSEPRRQSPPRGSRPPGIPSPRVCQSGPPLDTLDTEVHPVKPVRHISILVLKVADALLYLANIVAHAIDRATDMTQRFKNNVVRLGHGRRLS